MCLKLSDPGMLDRSLSQPPRLCSMLRWPIAATSLNSFSSRRLMLPPDFNRNALRLSSSALSLSFFVRLS